MSFKRISPMNMTYYDSVLYFFDKPYVGSAAEGVLEIIDLNKPLSDLFSEKKAWSTFLGKNGWAISPLIKSGVEYTLGIGLQREIDIT